LVVPVLTMVVAGLEAPVAAAATGVAGFPAWKLPTRAGEAGRLGLTVMRAVSLGGAVLTMEVPVLVLTSVGAAGTEAAGLSGA